MKFQKIMCLVMLLCGALSAVYSFIFCSGALASIGATINRDGGSIVPRPTFPEAMVYIDVQKFNDILLYLSIALIVASAILYITACNSRRNYYISNYVATGVVCALFIGVSIYIMVMTGIVLNRLNTEILNKPEVLAAFKAITDGNETFQFSTSTAPQIIGFVIYPIIIIASGLMIANLFWKRKLMQGERQLLAAEPVSEVS